MDLGGKEDYIYMAAGQVGILQSDFYGFFKFHILNVYYKVDFFFFFFLFLRLPFLWESKQPYEVALFSLDLDCFDCDTAH